MRVLQTMVEVVNMLPPPYMLPQKAAKPPAQLRCAVTGRPAKYRDPISGYGYVDLEAYKELKQRLQSERRGLTGKRTKRQSTKLPSMHRQEDTESDPAQLATAAAQHEAAAAPDAQASEPRQEVQSSPDVKAADVPGVAASSESVPAPTAAALQTAVIPDSADAARTTQSSLTGIPTPAAPGTIASAGADEAVKSASLAQQGSQQVHQSPASANAAAAGPGASAPQRTADMLMASAAVTCVAPPPTTSKPLASLAGKHT